MMGVGMMTGMLVFWIITIVLVVFLVKGLFGTNDSRNKKNVAPSKQILDERYARGEVTQEQYQTILKDIQ